MDQHPTTELHTAGLGVHSLDHFVFAVPDLEAAERFYSAFGLDVRRSAEDQLDLYCYGWPYRAVTIRRGSTKRLLELVFGAFGRDLPALQHRLERLAVDRLQVNKDGSLSLVDLDGLSLRIVVAEKSSPDRKSEPSELHQSVKPGAAACPLRSQASQAHPRRFSHALFFTRDVLASVDFYCTALGLRLSDEAGGEVAFLHGIHGSDHHLIAFSKGAGPGLHHSSWDVGSVQEIGLGMAQMTQAGYGANGWGLGRHVLGSNYFHYVRDPWDSYAEYSFDIDYVPADMEWHAGHHTPEDGFYLWGPKPPIDFTVNHELLRV